MESNRKTLFSSEIACDQEIDRLRYYLQDKCLIPELIPSELSNTEQWVVWSYQVGKQLNGMYRANKQPYLPTDPLTELCMDSNYRLADLDTAISTFYKCEHIDGIGYMFLEDDGLIGIDLDNCRDSDTGKISKEYLFWIKQLDSYTEVSPSGTGIKIWVKGSVPDSFFLTSNETGFRILNFAGGEIEIYRRGQYFTVTTQVMPGFDTIRNSQNELDVICEFSKSSINQDFSYISFPELSIDEINTELSLQEEWFETENVSISQDDLQVHLSQEREASELTYNYKPGSQLTNSNPQEKKRCNRCGRENYSIYELCSSCYSIGLPETVVVSSVSDYFSNFKDTTIQVEYDIQLGTYTPRADVVLLDKIGKIVAIAECKREAYVDNGIKQLKSYLSASDTQFGLFANTMNSNEWIFFENLRRYNYKEITKEEFEQGIFNPNSNPILRMFSNELNRLEEITLDINSKETIRQDYQKFILLDRKKMEKYNMSIQLSQESQEKEVIFYKIREVVNQLNISSSESEMELENCRKELIIEYNKKKETIRQLKIEISELNNHITNLEHEVNLIKKQICIENKPTYLQIEQEIDLLKSEKSQMQEDIGKQLFLLSTHTDLLKF